MTLAAPSFLLDRLIKRPHDELFEMIDGELAERTPRLIDSWLATTIASRIGNFAERNGGGWTLIETPIWCGEDVRRPSVSFFAAPPPREMWNDEISTIAPDLCVDVVLHDTTAKALERKTKGYFRAGVPLVWHVYPEARTIHIYQQDGTAAVLTDGGTLTGGDVLPGFGVAATDVLPPRAG